MKKNDSSITLKYVSKRMEEFQPNKKLDDLISKLKLILEPIQVEGNKNYTKPIYPVAIVVGCSRSGTTLLTQLLAASKSFAYPSNFLSRFAYAPQIGAMIQKLIFDPDYDFRNELADIQSTTNFHSQLGKTRGAMGVSEFFHFWRKFFPVHEPTYLTDDLLSQVNFINMRKELASVESVFEKPFISKGKMMQYNLKYFTDQMPELFVIYIKRNPLYVMQSIMLSRKKYYGSQDIWWGGRPKEYGRLYKMDPIYQVAGQVLFTEKNIDEQLSIVKEERKLVCRYEDVCHNPNKMYADLQLKFKNLGCTLNEFKIESNFQCGNFVKMDKYKLRRLETAYTDLSEMG